MKKFTLLLLLVIFISSHTGYQVNAQEGDIGKLHGQDIIVNTQGEGDIGKLH
jgi:hypothetical protein